MIKFDWNNLDAKVWRPVTAPTVFAASEYFKVANLVQLNVHKFAPTMGKLLGQVLVPEFNGKYSSIVLRN